MASNRYRVQPRSGEWIVKKDGADRASSVHPTQSKAIEAGRDLAKASGSELVIHRPDGRIRDADSYGNDPCPPHDRKH